MRAVSRIALVGALVLSLWSCSAGISGGAGKRPERRTQTFDFGNARQGTMVHHTFQVTNTTAVKLVIQEVKSTCGCTATSVKKGAIIEPGKTLEVPVDLNLYGKKSPVESKVTVAYAEGAMPEELLLKGTVAEEYESMVKLPDIKLGEQPEKVVTLATYAGQPPLEVTGIKFDAKTLDVTSRPGAQAGTVDVVIKPAAAPAYGALADTVTVTTNDTQAPDKAINVRVHVRKPFEPVARALTVPVGNDGKPVTAIAEFVSTYGGPITDVNVSISREKRFAAEVVPDSPPDKVRVRVTVAPPAKVKKNEVSAMLTVNAKIGGNDVRAMMNIVCKQGTADEGNAPPKAAGEPSDNGKH